jgi:hypothetical protein
MSDDIVTRLRLHATFVLPNSTDETRSEIVMQEAAKEIERLRDMANDLYETGDHQASCPPDEECTCGFTDAAYEYNKYATELYKTEQVNNEQAVQ